MNLKLDRFGENELKIIRKSVEEQAKKYLHGQRAIQYCENIIEKIDNKLMSKEKKCTHDIKKAAYGRYQCKKCNKDFIYGY